MRVDQEKNPNVHQLPQFHSANHSPIRASPDADGDEELAAHPLLRLEPSRHPLEVGEAGEEPLAAPHRVGDVGGAPAVLL